MAQIDGDEFFVTAVIDHCAVFKGGFEILDDLPELLHQRVVIVQCDLARLRHLDQLVVYVIGHFLRELGAEYRAHGVIARHDLRVVFNHSLIAQCRHGFEQLGMLARALLDGAHH